MPADAESTHWAWKRVKVREAAGGPSSRAPKGPSKPSMSTWAPREPLSLTVTYRGGAEAWYEIQTRGGVLRVPGWQTLDDVMAKVYRGDLKPHRARDTE